MIEYINGLLLLITHQCIQKKKLNNGYLISSEPGRVRRRKVCFGVHFAQQLVLAGGLQSAPSRTFVFVLGVKLDVEANTLLQ